VNVAKALINQSIPPKSKFTVNDIPDLSGKVIIVTGANTGVGYETAKVQTMFIIVTASSDGSRQALLLHNAKVYMASRSIEKSETAIKKLNDETGKDAIFLKLDLASLKSVKAAAEEFIRLVSCTTLSYFQYLIHVCLAKKRNSMFYLTTVA